MDDQQQGIWRGAGRPCVSLEFPSDAPRSHLSHSGEDLRPFSQTIDVRALHIEEKLRSARHLHIDWLP